MESDVSVYRLLVQINVGNWQPTEVSEMLRWVLGIKELKAPEKLVLIAICSLANESGIFTHLDFRLERLLEKTERWKLTKVLQSLHDKRAIYWAKHTYGGSDTRSAIIPLLYAAHIVEVFANTSYRGYPEATAQLKNHFWLQS